jgi:hypothetical protein
MSMDEVVRLLTSGVVGGFVGAFLGGFSKFFWERWLPDQLTWRREQHVRQRQLLATQRDPAVRAINELQGRLWVILSTGARNYHYAKQQGEEEYYIQSTAFLVAQYFAWSELMRRQMAALDYSDLSLLIEKVSEAFAHGSPGFQIYNLEQREIGERLMAQMKSDSNSAIFRYSDFRDLMAAPKPPERLLALRDRSQYLLDHIEKEQERATRIQNALLDLLDFVDAERRWVRPDRRRKFSPNGEALPDTGTESTRKKPRGAHDKLSSGKQ